jgi:GDSL-like Lipase/Acylhydrolase family
MVRQIIQLSIVRGGSLLPVSILLLTSAWVAPESRVVKMLLGPSSLEKGLGQAETRGYYENILDASKLPNNDPSGMLDDDTHLPPPGWIPFYAAGLVEAEPTYLLWKLRPNLDLRWNGTSFHTNNLGYRTPEVALEKPPHVYRILVFGSSNTMGHGVDDEALYPRLLEQWLNEQIGAKLCVEVVNLSIAGESPSRRLRRVREEGGRYQADWILCDASPLDHALEEDHLEAIVRGSRAREVPFEYVREALVRAGVTPADSPDSFRRKLSGEHEALLDGAYAGWREESDRLGIPLSVVILPRADRERQSPLITELIRSLAQRHGLDFLDLSDAFDGLQLEQFRVAAWDRHPSALGHRALFQTLRSELLRRGTLPGMPLGSAGSDPVMVTSSHDPFPRPLSPAASER